MPLDYRSPSPNKPRLAARFWLLAGGSAVTFLVLWCLLDFMRIRLAPSSLDPLYRLWPLLPVTVLLLGYRLFRPAGLAPRVVLSITGAVVATIFAVVLVQLVGLPLHLLIGGQL